MNPASWDRALVRARPVARVYVRLTRELQRRPLLAKAVPTGVGFAFGDFLTQYMNRDRSKAYRHNFVSTLAMAALGAAVAGPLGLGFLRWMDAHVLPGSVHPVAAGIKFTLDQVLGCVMWQFAYLSLHEHYRKSAHHLLTTATGQLTGSTEALLRQMNFQPAAAMA